MTHAERFRNLANQLGLSGGWLEVSRKALLDRTVRMPSGCYLLCWGGYAIVWLEDEQSIDNRIPPGVVWIYAWKEEPSDTGNWFASAFRACQEFAHREALLRQVGFHQWEGPFGLLECVSTPVTWEWK